jgi:hypothetical protein
MQSSGENCSIFKSLVSAQYGAALQCAGVGFGWLDLLATLQDLRGAPQLSTTSLHATCLAPNMSTSTHSSATDVDAGDNESPKIEALFLIRFDKKVGYVARQHCGISLPEHLHGAPIR